MSDEARDINALLRAIVNDDCGAARELLKENAQLATAQILQAKLYQSKIIHWLYAKDTALHLAAAGYRVDIVRLLLAAGADPNAAHNHRLGRPLHYAADNQSRTSPAQQLQTIRHLLKAGADIHAADKNGATALHRAVRTRCAAAVEFLLHAGADPRVQNHPGATPFHLAVQNTGKSGSGSSAAKIAQKEIIQSFLAQGVSPALQDAQGKSVLDWARSPPVRALLGA
jgi:ankyrin repeat protein